MTSQVQHIHSASEYQQALTKAGAQLVVVDFTAAWCGPCKVIAPIFDKLSLQYGKVATFLKVDVDEVQQVAQAAGVTAMPTFHFLKQGKKIDELKGAAAAQLEQLIKKHTVDAAASGASGAGEDFGVVGHTDLTAFVDMKNVECLNQVQDHGIRGVFQAASGTAYVESDCDEQLMITVPFTQNVKIHSIKFVAKDQATAPKTIKLFANRQQLGFDETESVECTQQLGLTEADYAVNGVTNLRFVKFQNVNSVVIFVQDNFGGGEVTQLKRLVFIGSPVGQTKDLSELKKEEK